MLTNGTKSAIYFQYWKITLKVEYYLGQLIKTTGTYPKTTEANSKTTGTFVPVVIQLKYTLVQIPARVEICFEISSLSAEGLLWPTAK